MKISLQQMRLTGINKKYWLTQLQTFADRFPSTIYHHIDFGKQDSRGAFTITFVDQCGCVPHQESFESKDHMLGFVAGVNASYQTYGIIHQLLGKN